MMTIKEGFVSSTVSSGLGMAGDVGGVVRHTFLPDLFCCSAVFKCRYNGTGTLSVHNTVTRILLLKYFFNS